MPSGARHGLAEHAGVLIAHGDRHAGQDGALRVENPAANFRRSLLRRPRVATSSTSSTRLITRDFIRCSPLSPITMQSKGLTGDGKHPAHRRHTASIPLRMAAAENWMRESRILGSSATDDVQERREPASKRRAGATQQSHLSKGMPECELDCREGCVILSMPFPAGCLALSGMRARSLVQSGARSTECAHVSLRYPYSVCFSACRPRPPTRSPARHVRDRATGETYHVEVGGFFWSPTPDIAITSESLPGIPGSRIDFVEDLGIEQTAPSGSCKVVLRPATKHKFRFEYTPISYEAVGDRSPRTFVFNGHRFTGDRSRSRRS